MPIFDGIVYTRHALDRMTQRRISREDVELTQRVGEGRPGTLGSWVYERGPYRVLTSQCVAPHRLGIASDGPPNQPIRSASQSSMNAITSVRPGELKISCRCPSHIRSVLSSLEACS